MDTSHPTKFQLKKVSGTRYCSYFTIHIAISSWLDRLSTVHGAAWSASFVFCKFLFGHLRHLPCSSWGMLQPFAERVQVDGSDGWQFIRRPSTLHRRMESASKVQHVSVRIYTETSAASAWVVWYWTMKWTLWPGLTTKTFIFTIQAVHEYWFYISLLDPTRDLKFSPRKCRSSRSTWRCYRMHNIKAWAKWSTLRVEPWRQWRGARDSGWRLLFWNG